MDDITDFSQMYQYGEFVFEKADSKKFADKTIIKRLTDTNQSLVYALPNIERAEFELYKNGLLESKSVDIYTSKDGISYKKIDKVINNKGAAVPNSEYTKYKVSSKSIEKGVQFVKLEVKNDSIVYCPMVGKTEIIYDQDSHKIIDLNIEQKSLSVHVNESGKLNLKIAPLTINQDMIWESKDETIATVDSTGKVTGKKAGSTTIYAKYNEDIYTSCVVNVLTENLALKKATGASTETNEWEKNPTKSLANDGDMSTRWVSRNGTNVTREHFEIDFGEEKLINNVKIFWEAARAKDFNIEVSTDGINYTIIKEIRGKDSLSLVDDISFDTTKTRFVRMQGLVPVGKYGYSIYEFQVYNNSDLNNVENISFDKSVLDELYLGERIPLKTIVTPSDATYQDVTYSSSNNNIIVIRHNELIAVGLGEATITATLDGKVISREITVVKDNTRSIAKSTDKIEVKGNQLVLPQFDGYTVSIHSSDIEKIVAKDSLIHQPVETTNVKIVLHVTEKTKSKQISIGTNTLPIEVILEGSKEKYNQLLNLIKDIISINEDDYTKETMRVLKTELTHTYQVLILDNLLVSEVEKAYNQLQEAYTSLQKNIVINPDNQDQPNIAKPTDKDNVNNANQNRPESQVQTSDHTNNTFKYVIVVMLSAIVSIALFKKKKGNK